MAVVLATTTAFVPPPSLPLCAGARRAPTTRRYAVEMKAGPRMPIKKGSMVALVTPMKPDGAIDEAQLRALLQWHVASQTDGVVVLGTTGEASTLSFEERARVLDITAEEVKGKIPIVVGTGTIDPKTVVKLTKQAVDHGADASLVVTPYYVKPTQKGLVTHFGFVAEAVDLPCLLYNVPGRTGSDIKPETAAEVAAKHPSVIGIKEATGDVSRVAAIRKLAGEKFLLYSGDDETGAEFVLKGGDGVISVTSNIVPDVMHQLMMAALAKDAKKTEALNKPLELLHQRLFLQSNPIPAKWALYRMGRIGAGIRPPMTVLEEEFHKPLEEALKAAGAI